MFRTKLNSTRATLETLKERDIIDDKTYRYFLLLIQGAKTFDQLDEIGHDLVDKSSAKILGRLIHERFVTL